MAGVDEFLDRLAHLPALPSSAARIIGALNSDDIELKEIEEMVRCDEAVSVAVLRWANSARFGRPGRVFSLKESIGRLGRKMLLKIAMQQQISTVLEMGGAAYGLTRGSLWRGALGGALIAEQIARDESFEDADLCFLCALLRDIGKLALDTVVGQGEMLTPCEVEGDDRSFLEIEREIFAADHAQIGAELARRWQLPSRIADAIAFHHDPPPPDDDRHDLLFDIVHAADVVCLWTGLATGCDGLRYLLTDHVRTGILRKRERAETYIAEMWVSLRDLESELELTSNEERTA